MTTNEIACLQTSDVWNWFFFNYFSDNLLDRKCYFLVSSDKADRDSYTARIERIRRWNDLQVCYQNVTREEKDLIVRAMGLAQGHWFKCPKGEHHQINVLLYNTMQ